MFGVLLQCRARYVKYSVSWMWDHVLEAHEGQGSEVIHEDFDFFLTDPFQKPLERQVDEMRRLDCVERKGKATITVMGKRKEIDVKKESMNRKEERFNLGGRRVRADFGPAATRPKDGAPAPTMPSATAPAAATLPAAAPTATALPAAALPAAAPPAVAPAAATPPATALPAAAPAAAVPAAARPENRPPASALRRIAAQTSVSSISPRRLRPRRKGTS